jgi:MutS domain V
MSSNPAADFDRRSADFALEKNRYRRKARTVAWLRLIIFLAGLSAAIYLFNHNQNQTGFLVAGLSYVLFLVALKVHTRFQYTQRHFGFLEKINAEELARLKGQLAAFNPGERFRDARHPYTSDLDIFGPHSLFQLLNRAVSSLGQQQLADWLAQGAPAAEITDRQQAMQELAADIGWRQHLQAKALHYQHTVEEPFLFFDWLQAPDFYRDKGWLKALVFILPLWTLGGLVYFFTGHSFYPAAAGMLAQYLLCFKYTLARDTYYDKSSGMYDVLRSYRDLLRHLESRPSQARRLVQLQQKLVVAGTPASQHVHQLATIVEYLSARMNVFMSFFLNAVFMWDFWWMYRLENWKKKMAPNLKEVLSVVAETEALASLAAFSYANPGYALPELSPQPFEINTRALGHPLIFSAGRITNDFCQTGAGQTGIITGSNMSGKSTFLRTVAINLVLAQAGGVTSAAAFRFYPAQIFTAMRTEDNLAESTSSFYAELKRLRLLLDLSATGLPVFYFLDEILKGTNSRDRHAGAKALIRQLHHRFASGLVSTHDLELGAMQQEHPDYITNYSFNSSIEGDQIYFDYKLHPGICQSFNASKLMQLMGIEIN